MGGMGPAGKRLGTHAGHSPRVHSSAAVLHQQTEEDEIEKPKLPKRANGTGMWHWLTKEWWADVWASPMAREFDKSDWHGLFALAMLVNDFWTAETPKERQAASAEIRLQAVRFGLSPIDRRRLQWQIETTGEAQARGKSRRAREADEAKPPTPAPTGPADPRNVLEGPWSA